MYDSILHFSKKMPQFEKIEKLEANKMKLRGTTKEIDKTAKICLKLRVFELPKSWLATASISKQKLQRRGNCTNEAVSQMG